MRHLIILILSLVFLGCGGTNKSSQSSSHGEIEGVWREVSVGGSQITVSHSYYIFKADHVTTVDIVQAEYTEERKPFLQSEGFESEVQGDQFIVGERKCLTRGYYIDPSFKKGTAVSYSINGDSLSFHIRDGQREYDVNFRRVPADSDEVKDIQSFPNSCSSYIFPNQT